MAGSRRPKGDKARVTAVFQVPLDFAFRWCTDFTPEDAALEGESYQRRVIERTPRRVIFEDLEETPSGWVWARDVITLRPPNRWHMESVGSHRNVTADYRLTELPDGRTQLELVWWRQHHAPGKRVPVARRQAETGGAWKKFAAAMEMDYHKTQ
jgi:hypothetical protein